MLPGNPDNAWKKFGECDPYFAVCTQDQYRFGRLTQESRARFFQSGSAHVEQVFSLIRRHLNEGFQSKQALDFGCGVGRLVLPLARQCSQVVGVDISEAMLAEARKNCEAEGLGNVAFAISDDALSRVEGTFDFIHSFIVFQHIPPRRGLRIISALIDRLEPRGVGALHVTFSSKAPPLRRWIDWARKTVPWLHGSINLVRGRPFSYPMMQMNDYPLSALFRLLYDKSCDHAYTRLTDHGGHLGLMLLFQKTTALSFQEGWPCPGRGS